MAAGSVAASLRSELLFTGCEVIAKAVIKKRNTSISIYIHPKPVAFSHHDCMLNSCIQALSPGSALLAAPTEEGISGHLNYLAGCF